MSDPLGQCQCFATDRQGLLGISEQPMGLRAHVARAHARVVAAIEQAVGAVPLRIIEPAPRLAVLAGSRRLAGKQTGRPGAVMRLQTQSVVRVVRGQLQQPVRQSAALDHPAGAIGRLPKAVDRHEQLARDRPAARPARGRGYRLRPPPRTKPFGREQRQAAGQLQFDLPPVASRPSGSAANAARPRSKWRIASRCAERAAACWPAFSH